MSIGASLVGVWVVVIGVWGWKALSRLRGAQGAWEAANWRRCHHCGEMLVSANRAQKHLGHRLGPAHAMTGIEYLYVMVGML